MEYNYVFFDGSNSYFRIARSELNTISSCKIREYGILPNSSKLTNMLYKLHTSRHLNNDNLVIPLQRIWNKACLGELEFTDNKPICFLFSTFLTRYFDMDLFAYLRKNYNKCKIVLMMRDTFQVCQKQFGGKSIDELKEVFDLIYTINQFDAERYGLRIIQVMCSQYIPPKDHSLKHSDIVFVGKVKDRGDTINRLYTKLVRSNITCDFVLLNNDSSVKIVDGIKVIDKPIEYEEMLARTMNANCILEITQKGISSLSSRCLEALCYNKKLLTDVADVRMLPYYNDRYMRIFSNVDEIDPEFIKEKIPVDYHYDGKFSPIHLLESIDSDLVSMQ